jgi:hypothetical protein
MIMQETHDWDTLVFVAKDIGLANRLRALIGYDALAQLLNRRFLLCWVPDVGFNVEFSDLFDSAAFTLISADHAADLRRSSRVCATNDPSWFHEIWQQYLPQIPWLDFLQAVSVSLSHLRPVSTIEEACARVNETHPMSRAAGVHIRHTDNVDLHTIRSQLDPGFDVHSASTLEGFRLAIRAHIRLGPVFLATDNPSVERELRQEFGEMVFTYPKAYDAEWCPGADPRTALLTPRTTRPADALIEMFLLRSCRQITGTYYSSFSEFSALWGCVDYCEVKGNSTGRNQRIDNTTAELKALASASPVGQRRGQGGAL